MQATAPGRDVWRILSGYLYRLSGNKKEADMLFLVALLIILIVAGAGFALHVLWWIAIAALIVWLLGFFFRR